MKRRSQLKGGGVGGGTGTMVGVGLTMEATNQNPIMYELGLDHAWHLAPRPVHAWVETWVHSRYSLHAFTASGSASTAAAGTAGTAGTHGHLVAQLVQSWMLLVKSCYSGNCHKVSAGVKGSESGSVGVEESERE